MATCRDTAARPDWTRTPPRSCIREVVTFQCIFRLTKSVFGSVAFWFGGIETWPFRLDETEYLTHPCAFLGFFYTQSTISMHRNWNIFHERCRFQWNTLYLITVAYIRGAVLDRRTRQFMLQFLSCRTQGKVRWHVKQIQLRYNLFQENQTFVKIFVGLHRAGYIDLFNVKLHFLHSHKT